VKRREFIAGLGGAAAWPMVARAQQPSMPVIGCLMNSSQEKADYILVPFLQGLADTGFTEGRNLKIEYRWAEGHDERLEALAADLVNMQVTALAVPGGASGALAAKRLTTTIPIIFATGGNAIALGLVTSLSKPESNLTGISGFADSLVTKQFGLLGEFVAKSAPYGLLVNPLSPNAKALVANTQAAATATGRNMQIVSAGNPGELDTAFAQLADHHAGGLIVPQNSLFIQQRDHIIQQRDHIAALAARFGIPTIYDARESVVAGGLMSYGVNYPEIFHQLGIYTGKILHGAKPGDLPVFQPSKFDFVINMKTAKALGLQVPISMQLLADEVIE
jgi:putative tryptophan/tyrosine transport system substrate-binding protein